MTARRFRLRPLVVPPLHSVWPSRYWAAPAPLRRMTPHSSGFGFEGITDAATRAAWMVRAWIT